MKPYKVIDIHVHYPAIDENLIDNSSIKKINKFILFGLTISVYSMRLGIPLTNNLKLLKDSAEKLLLNEINKSSLDHAVVFGVDGQYDINGKVVKNSNFLWCDNDYVFKLAERNKKILPGVSINPTKPSAISELNYYAKKGAALVKVHPSFQNFNPENPKFIKFCEEAYKLSIPILIHVGFESAIPGLMQGPKEFNSIDRLELALKTGCKIIAAHGGGTPIKFFGSEKETFNKVKKISNEYPNLYFDISAIFNIHRPNRATNLLSNKDILNKCLYASDYPNVSKGEKLIFKIGVRKYFKIFNDSNVFNRDINLKKRIGFNKEIFNSAYRIINPLTIKKIESDKNNNN